MIHLAVIMDGNRRWARERNLLSIEGHRAGVKALKTLVETAPAHGIKYLTAYAFSTENWKRTKTEKDFLFKLLGETAIREANDLCKNNVRVRFLGDLSVFADSPLLQILDDLQRQTEYNSGLCLQIALNYGSLNELCLALRKIKSECPTEHIKNISVEDLPGYFYLSDLPDPDILLRTGGEQRLSNFLLWQSVNAELRFLDALWPDFNEGHLKQILKTEGALSG